MIALRELSAVIARWRLRRTAGRRLREMLAHDLEPVFVRESSRRERLQRPARQGDDERPWRFR